MLTSGCLGGDWVYRFPAAPRVQDGGVGRKPCAPPRVFGAGSARGSHPRGARSSVQAAPLCHGLDPQLQRDTRRDVFTDQRPVATASWAIPNR